MLLVCGSASSYRILMRFFIFLWSQWCYKLFLFELDVTLEFCSMRKCTSNLSRILPDFGETSPVNFIGNASGTLRNLFAIIISTAKRAQFLLRWESANSIGKLHLSIFMTKYSWRVKFDIVLLWSSSNCPLQRGVMETFFWLDLSSVVCSGSKEGTRMFATMPWTNMSKKDVVTRLQYCGKETKWAVRSA